jgi:hypothetical protein
VPGWAEAQRIELAYAHDPNAFLDHDDALRAAGLSE